MEQFKTLVLGIGRWEEPLAKGEIVGVDIVKTEKVDIIWDLNQFPYPFNDKEFDLVILRDVLEHLNEPLRVMEEVWRVLKDNGKVFIRVRDADHPEIGWRDITHKRLFTLETFDIFDPYKEYCQNFGYITKARFIVIKRKKKNKGLEFWLQKYENSNVR